jgi:hypothetical protein
MATDIVELWSTAALVVVLLAGYLWLRNYQHRKRQERQRKLKCKDLILDNRIPLARRKVDFTLLADLVKLGIDLRQLEKVVELLTAVPVEYHIDEDEQEGGFNVDLDFDGALSDSKDSEAPVGDGQDQTGDDMDGEEIVEVEAGMPAEKEKAWFRMAHNRFRHALADKEITERQARFRMLVKMVELGKKAVQDDGTKPVNRKEYELELWDRFYENEYLELNSE